MVAASESSVRHGWHQVAQTMMTIRRPWSRWMGVGSAVDVLGVGRETGLVAVLWWLSSAIAPAPIPSATITAIAGIAPLRLGKRLRSVAFAIRPDRARPARVTWRCAALSSWLRTWGRRVMRGPPVVLAG